jgi:hypothetical protein
LEFEGARDRARPLVKKIFCTEDDLTDEVGELKAYLKTMHEGAGKIVGRRLQPADRVAINGLSKAAKELFDRLDNRAGGAFEGLRTTRDTNVTDAVKTIVGE